MPVDSAGYQKHTRVANFKPATDQRGRPLGAVPAFFAPPVHHHRREGATANEVTRRWNPLSKIASRDRLGYRWYSKVVALTQMIALTMRNCTPFSACVGGEVDAIVSPLPRAGFPCRFYARQAFRACRRSSGLLIE
ncbi:hypothetical protein TBK1r_62830 [Stieleria magnilauensis]|uniref:Transposase DDE domain-containing protein n=1 Tax=Stieleria magnilauensis TaxID=2527963 RepID=A0ABX5XYY8_9BACT|nr:hypothetical protein TBK1r_62830 [Planctomycetes bacterium TBK1r]